VRSRSAPSSPHHTGGNPDRERGASARRGGRSGGGGSSERASVRPGSSALALSRARRAGSRHLRQSPRSGRDPGLLQGPSSRGPFGHDAAPRGGARGGPGLGHAAARSRPGSGNEVAAQYDGNDGMKNRFASRSEEE